MGIIEIPLGVLLAALAAEDLKSKRIKIFPVTAAFILGIINFIVYHQPDAKSLLGGVALGGGICLLWWITGKNIGLGDGLVIALIGIYRGLKFTVICLCAAFFLAAPAALILCCLKKGKKKGKIPFIPFLFLGYGLVSFIKGGLR